MATRAAGEILSRVKGAEYVALDEGLRGHGYYSGYSPTKNEIATWQFGEGSWVPLAIASCSYNGYVREASVIKLKGVDPSHALPFFLLRANDWVKEVRDVAKEAILDRLSPQHAPFLVRNIYLVTRLRIGRAGTNNELVDAVEQLLQKDNCVPVLLEGLEASGRTEKRACYRIVIAKDIAPWVVERGLAENDPVIRLFVVEKALDQGLLEWGSNRWDILLSDWYMPVRRAALLALFDASTDKATLLLFKHLCDSNSAIRALSRAGLKYHDQDLDTLTFTEYYKGQLTKHASQELARAIGGLGECGDNNDAELIAPFLKHSSSRVRRAAIRALYKLDKDRYVEEFIDALVTDGPGTSREARIALSLRKSPLSAQRLEGLLETASTRHAKLNILVLISEGSRWQRLPPLLHSVKDQDIVVRERAIKYLHGWIESFNKDYSQPRPHELASALDRLNTVSHILGRSFTEQIAFYLN